VVVVTHRTALVQQVDKLLVIEGGRPQHYGPVGEVLRAMQAQAAAASEAGKKVVTMPLATAAMEKSA
jgi:ABC-type protease/lipase transport system fused ATPase/permease subunit